MLYNALNLPSLKRNHRVIGKTARKRVVFGQSVYWDEYDGISDNARHLTGEMLEPYRSIGDPELDDILEAFAAEGRPIEPGTHLFDHCHQTQNVPKSPAEEQLAAFWKTYSSSPPWDVDFDQLKRGQNVFLHYSPAMGLSLYYRSLVPGFSIPKIARVLQKTGYLAPPSKRDRVGERLMDTGAFLTAIFADPVSTLQPGGRAWNMCLQVRLLHAKVRRAVLKSNWNAKENGIPINQEDMAATLLAFSINSIVGVELLLMGMIQISDQEQRDYIALWRYVGWLLGVHVVDRNKNNAIGLRPLDPCGPGWIGNKHDPISHSYAVFESIINHLMKPDTLSVQIAQHLLCIGRSTEKRATNDHDDDVWYYRRAFQCRRFIGNPLADALLFPVRETWWQYWEIYTWTTLRMVLISFYTVAGLPWSPFRGLLRWFHRKQLRRFLEHWDGEHPKRNRERLKADTTCPFAMVAPPS